MAECQKMEEQKVPPVEFEAPKPEKKEENERIIKVDNNLWMKEGEIFTVRSLANAFGIDRTSAWKKIKKLVNKGMLKKLGKKKLDTNRKAPAYMVIKNDKKNTEAKPDKKAKKQKADKAKPKNKPAPVDEKKWKKIQQEEYTKIARELLDEHEKSGVKHEYKPLTKTDKKDEGYNFQLGGELATDAGEVKASFDLAVQVDADVLQTPFMKTLLYRLFDTY